MEAAKSASFISAREVLSALQGGQPPLIIDVRREQAFRAATDMIAGALWRDPERVTEWAGELPRASRVVAYCVHGHEVSQGVAKALGEHGIAAKVLKGGIEEGWKAAGGALDILRDELVRAMQLSGVRSVGEIGPDLIARSSPR